MATSGLLKRLATNGRDDLRPGSTAVQRPNTQGKGTRIGALWILGDVVIVLAALMIAVRGWLGEGLFGADSPYRTNLMFYSHPTLLMGCLLWFICSLILVSKRYHLYGPMQMRNTLHEQRLTIQASLTAGLLALGSSLPGARRDYLPRRGHHHGRDDHRIALHPAPRVANDDVPPFRKRS